MNLKRGHFIFILQICPLLVYGTIEIVSTGTQIIGEKLVLTCILSLFTGTASWNQDGIVRSTCTPTFCTVYTYGTYTTFTNGSNHINVTFYPVDSSIDGVWECTHSLLGSDSFNVTAMNKTQSSGGTSTSTDNLVKVVVPTVVGLVILLVVCLLVRMKYVNNGASRSLSCILNGTVTPQDKGKSQKKATVDKRQQPDGDEGPQSTPKDPDDRNLTTGRPLPPKPDIALPQTGSFDSVNSPKRIVLASIENPNIHPSIDTLDEQKMDKKPKDKKKKKKKKKEEEQDNPADIQDNNVLT